MYNIFYMNNFFSLKKIERTELHPFVHCVDISPLLYTKKPFTVQNKHGLFILPPADT